MSDASRYLKMTMFALNKNIAQYLEICSGKI